jgi:hypothetical protein
MTTRKTLHRPSRRQFLGGAGAVGAALATAGSQATANAQAQASLAREAAAGDTLLTNGRIHTLDGTNRVVRSVLIHSNRIAAVGDRLARPRARASSTSRAARWSRPRRAPRPHHQSRQPPRLPHHPREHGLHQRGAAGPRRASQERARGAVDHVDGRLASESVGRASPPHVEGARRSGARSSGAPLRALHRPRGHQLDGQEALRRHRRRRLRCTRT